MDKESVRDNAGNTIRIGNRCCFNYQGQIALGIIKEIKTGMRYGRVYVYFKIQRLMPKPEGISTVIDCRNLMVIP